MENDLGFLLEWLFYNGCFSSPKVPASTFYFTSSGLYECLLFENIYSSNGIKIDCWIPLQYSYFGQRGEYMYLS